MTLRPDEFVYLHDVAPEILIDIRYATENNFTGKVVVGYEKEVCIITKTAANVLKEINSELNAVGYNLKVFDAYRPKRASKSFVDWTISCEDEDPNIKQMYYPHITKKEILGKYIADGLSAHARGGTVDLTIVEQLSGNELDMGAIFDFFDETSHTENANISTQAKQNRALLKGIMEKHGFKNLWTEWWHYTLIDEPYKDQHFDFIVR